MSSRKRLFLFVGLPTLIIGLYYFAISSDMYISETRFSVRGAENSKTNDATALFGQQVTVSSIDAFVVHDYILSMDMLNIINKKLNLKSHYSNRDADIISRLESNPSAEEFLVYYRKIISVNYDQSTAILTVKIRAYSPEMAQKLGQVILEESELLVNRMRERALLDSLVLSRNEVAIAEKRVLAARDQMKQLRDKTTILDPESIANEILGLVAGLEEELSKLRADLTATRTYMREDSARVISLKTRIAALEGQVAESKSRLTGRGSQVLNEVAGDFDQHTLEQQFAEKQYSMALTALENARISAASKGRYLVAFAAPSLPDEALYPRRFAYTGLAGIMFLLLYGITSLVIAAIREHAGF